MKAFMIPLLGAIFVTLILGYTESVHADHSEPGPSIFKDSTNVHIVDSNDSKYQIYLQAIIRNGDGQLISVIDNTGVGAYIPHKITDYVFDTVMGEKEIVSIDNIKYEKAQYTFTPALEYRYVQLYPIFTEVPFRFDVTEDDITIMLSKTMEFGFWKLDYCAVFKEPHDYSCIPIFQVLVSNITMEPNDDVTLQWTILRELS